MIDDTTLNAEIAPDGFLYEFHCFFPFFYTNVEKMSKSFHSKSSRSTHKGRGCVFHGFGAGFTRESPETFPCPRCTYDIKDS